MAALYTLFDFSDDRLSDKATVIGLMQAIAQEDHWQFLKKAIVCDDSPGEIYVPNTPQTIAGAWHNAIRAAPRYNGAYWMEFQNAQGVQVNFGIDPKNYQRLNLTVDSAVFRGDTGAQSLEDYLAVAHTIYNHLQPAYGYGFFNYDMHMPYPSDSIPRAVWDVNYFGADYVASLPANTFDALDCAVCDPLPDGGVYLRVSAHPPQTAARDIGRYKAVAEKLGLNQIYVGGGL